jgi:K+ transporter
MYTWREGRLLTNKKLHTMDTTLEQLHNNIVSQHMHKYPGINVFLTSLPDGIPVSLAKALEHTPCLPDVVILLNIQFQHVPYVKPVKAFHWTF